MSDTEVLKQASKAMTEEPIRMEIDVIPTSRLHAWGQKKKLLRSKRLFFVRPITLGSLARISSLLLDINIEEISQEKFMRTNYVLAKNHSETMAEALAIAVTNNRIYPPKKLIRFFVHNLTSKELAVCLAIVLKQMDLTSFIGSIISISGMNVLSGKEKKNGSAGVSPQVTAR